MTLVYYDTDKYKAEQIHRVAQTLEEKLNDKILFLPKDFSVIINATVEQLEYAKQMLEAAIKLKEN